jgi:hypothetical protein
MANIFGYLVNLQHVFAASQSEGTQLLIRDGELISASGSKTKKTRR